MVYRIAEHISDINPEAWQKLIKEKHSPFLDYFWLHACEESGSMSIQTGWKPCHVLVFSSESSIGKDPLFVLPMYLKSHSWGEFVFDFEFIEFFESIGKRYFPKAVGVIPATPVMAYDFLAEQGYEYLLEPALNFITEIFKRSGIQSISFLYTSTLLADLLEKIGFTRWIHHGFNWNREGIHSFEDYLAGFGKNQRRNIRREQSSLQEQGLHIRRYTGSGLNEEIAVDMYSLYAKTNAQFGPWSAKFFNRGFFTEVFRNCARYILVLSAETSEGRPIARSMLLCKNGKLYGRYWGCREYQKNLHFNLCYYEPIKFAIEEGLDCFDPGLGGEHKRRRGFKSCEHYSMHKFFDSQMQEIFDISISSANQALIETLSELNA